MELPRKFEFFPISHYKTILFSSESEFSMKNVFFWGTSCWCSSKIKKVEGGLISCNCSLWLPLQISWFLIWLWFLSQKYLNFIIFSSESEFSMKNVFFWGTSCWGGTKIKKLGGVLISYNCSPRSTFLIFELYQHDVSQKNTFFIENSDSEEKSIVL